MCDEVEEEDLNSTSYDDDKDRFSPVGMGLDGVRKKLNGVEDFCKLCAE